MNAPSPPIIESDSATSDSITVNWRRPTETNIYSYEISLDGGPPITLGPDEFSYTFRYLEPATEHMVALRVTTNEGAISLPVTERLSTGNQCSGNWRYIKGRGDVLICPCELIHLFLFLSLSCYSVEQRLFFFGCGRPRWNKNVLGRLSDGRTKPNSMTILRRV